MFSTAKSFLLTYHRVIFYILWLSVNLVQAFSTELFDDEAYYWLYSTFPAWGYFDHPPMVAILIRMGYAIFHNEFGVRLMAVLLSTASLFLIESLIAKKNAPLFYAICASLAIAQIGGMMAVPDTPLIFFTVLFFVLYRRFVTNMSLANTLLLGIGIALMLYTKYHAVLIVLFTALSNLKLLKQRQAYLALLISIILFIPHLYWQYLHGFPSVRFHLFERNAEEYNIMFTIEYILGQIIFAGPLMGWLLILAALKYKPASLTEKALRFTFVDIYIFFLFSTLKGKAEANWTIPSFTGLIILAHQYLLTNKKWRIWLYTSVPFTLALVFMARGVMMINLPPAWWLVKDEFHGNREWIEEVDQKAANNPVVFLNSYQKASKYAFYSGNTSMSLNTSWYRRNNYNFWQIENSLNGKPAYVVGGRENIWLEDSLNDPRLKKNAGKMVQDYFSFSRILIDKITTEQASEKKLSVKFHTSTPPSYLAHFKEYPYDTVMIHLALYEKKKLVTYLPSGLGVKDITEPEQDNIADINLNAGSGDYSVRFVISSCVPDLPSMNSSSFHVSIK